MSDVKYVVTDGSDAISVNGYYRFDVREYGYRDCKRTIETIQATSPKMALDAIKEKYGIDADDSGSLPRTWDPEKATMFKTENHSERIAIIPVGTPLTLTVIGEFVRFKSAALVREKVYAPNAIGYCTNHIGFHNRMTRKPLTEDPVEINPSRGVIDVREYMRTDLGVLDFSDACRILREAGIEPNWEVVHFNRWNAFRIRFMRIKHTDPNGNGHCFVDIPDGFADNSPELDALMPTAGMDEVEIGAMLDAQIPHQLDLQDAHDRKHGLGKYQTATSLFNTVDYGEEAPTELEDATEVVRDTASLLLDGSEMLAIPDNVDEDTGIISLDFDFVVDEVEINAEEEAENLGASTEVEDAEMEDSAEDREVVVPLGASAIPSIMQRARNRRERGDNAQFLMDLGAHYTVHPDSVIRELIEARVNAAYEARKDLSEKELESYAPVRGPSAAEVQNDWWLSHGCELLAYGYRGVSSTTGFFASRQWKIPHRSYEEINEMALDAQMGDEDAKEFLCISCGPIVRKVAMRFRWAFQRISMMDLYQSGQLGVLKALQSWDCEVGTDFVGWARYYIYAEISKAVTLDSHQIRLPYEWRILKGKLPRIRAELEAELERRASYEEMAYHIFLNSYHPRPIAPQRVEFLENHSVSSSNANVFEEDGESKVEAQDLYESPERDIAESNATAELADALKSVLTDEERTIVDNYVETGGTMTFAEIGIELLAPNPQTGNPYSDTAVNNRYQTALMKMRGYAHEVGIDKDLALDQIRK